MWDPSELLYPLCPASAAGSRVPGSTSTFVRSRWCGKKNALATSVGTMALPIIALR